MSTSPIKTSPLLPRAHHPNRHHSFRLKVDKAATIPTGNGIFRTLAWERIGNLHVNNLTSNDGIASYAVTNKIVPVFGDVWNVNPPPRVDIAPSVNRPTWSGGHIGNCNFDAAGQAKIIWRNSWWQTTGCSKDVKHMRDPILPSKEMMGFLMWVGSFPRPGRP